MPQENHGVTEQEAEAVIEFIRVLKPCLKRIEGGKYVMYETTHGKKTALGLYRTVKDIVREEFRHDQES